MALTDAEIGRIEAVNSTDRTPVVAMNALGSSRDAAPRGVRVIGVLLLAVVVA